MPHQQRSLQLQGVDEASQVALEGLEAVVAVRLIGQPVAAQIRSQHLHTVIL